LLWEADIDWRRESFFLDWGLGHVLNKFLARLRGRSGKDLPAAGKTKSDNPESGRESCVQPSLTPQRRLYCIGDIHGRLDLLEELHGMIREDSNGFDGSKAVVYLGDYIDRGAQSSQVLDLLIGQTLDDFETVYLMGNHEQSMLNFLQDPIATAAWLSYGGQVALLSYGVGLGRVNMMQNVEILRDELEEKLPQSHLDFLHSCRPMYTEGSYCFVHAGIRPGVPLEDQQPEDVFWIRDEFTRSRVCHSHIVVHGHTISEEVEWWPNRIGIDTGAYETGLLTALMLEGKEQRLLQTGRGG
jgi:serine/threonine protein phosphatase 1